MSYLVKSYMKKDIPTIEHHISVTEAAKAMSKTGRGYIIILKNRQPVGIVTEHDFVNKIIVRELDPAKVSVGEIMSSPIITVDPDEDLLKASEIMHKHNIRRLPVVKDGIIYGVITARDIAQGAISYVDRATREIIRWSSRFGM